MIWRYFSVVFETRGGLCVSSRVRIPAERRRRRRLPDYIILIAR